MKINYGKLGNLLLGISGALSAFVLIIDVSKYDAKIAAVIAALGVMGKAICSEIDSYQRDAAVEEKAEAQVSNPT
jgi:hypothetical protein